MTSRTIYRILQKGLTNARKHAPEQPITVALNGKAGTGLTLEIRHPIAPAPLLAPPIPGSGLGLVRLTERATLAGGRLEYGPANEEFRL